MAVDRRRRRLWICGRRCHHGATGALLATVGLLTASPAGPVLFGIGVALMFDDLADFPWTPTIRNDRPLGEA